MDSITKMISLMDFLQTLRFVPLLWNDAQLQIIMNVNTLMEAMRYYSNQGNETKKKIRVEGFI